MRKAFFLFLFAIVVITAKAQNHSTVKAIILDSLNKQPVPFATISILKLQDSSLLSYTITDKNGAFTLFNLHEGDSRLLISHVGFQSLRVSLNLKKGAVTDLGKLYLSAKTLQEVIVKGERIPVIIKKDTIEFDAEAFKTRPNALVEDLLRKLPGVQVDHDGKITVNGKDISKIKIDGKDFFVNDPKIATKNLEADMISKVQVYDDREYDPDHLVPDYAVKKIINLKFKKAFKQSSFGTATVGAGTDDRYQANAFFSKFRDDLQVGFNAYSNNLSGTDLFGNGEHMSAVFGGSSSIIKTNTGSVNISKNFNKTLKLNVVYSFGGQVNDTRSATQRQQFVNDTTFKTNSVNIQHSLSDNQDISARLEWDPDTINSFKYAPEFNYTYNNSNNSGNSISSTNFLPLLNTSINGDHGSGSSVQFQHDLRYYRKLNKKGASFSIINNISIHPNNNIDFNANDLVSYIASLASDTIRRSTKTSNTSGSGNLTAAIHYPITKKLSADVSVSDSHERNGADLFTYDEDLKTGLYSIFLPDQSSNLIRSQWQQTVNPLLTYKFTDKISFKAGLASQFQQISNHFSNSINDLNQHFFYLLPSAELHVNKLTLSYGTQLNQPSISDLQPITIVYSPLFTFIGNPDLKPTRIQNFTLNYFDFKSQSQLYLYASSRITIETNSILRERSINAEGAEVTTPINRNGRFTAGLNGSVGKTFKKINKWKLSENISVNGTMGHNFFEVNQQDGYQNTTSVNVTEESSANYNDVIDIISSYNVNYAITKYQLINYNNTSYATQMASLAVYLYLPKKYSWAINYSYKYNPLVAQNFQRNSNLLSASIARKVQKKDKGEFRLTCYDLLNQGVSSYHFASENTINDGQYQILKRYFLLSYSYRFNDFKNH